MSNRIQKALAQDKKLLSVYFSAGFPTLDSTVTILEELEKNGVDMVEIGLPFSDPLADGPTIQESSTEALKNGMSTEVLFNQLASIRETVSIPLLIMGYFNPMLQYGVEAFCKKCHEIGIDGLIIPDLPVQEFHDHYKATFDKYGLVNVFLITPQTSEERINYIDSISNGFIYMVSSASTTGAKNDFAEGQEVYFDRITAMNLKNPRIVGFGISNTETFTKATTTTNGAIVGSAFINHLRKNGVSQIDDFVESIRPVKADTLK